MTKAAAAPPTDKPVEKSKVQLEIEAKEHNLRLWSTLGKTDPGHTKRFKRGGGFQGTAVKPMWVNKMLTEKFGPAGVGWGANKPDYTTVIGQDGEVLVYCVVECWYIEPGTKTVATMYGVGGDKCASWVGQGDNKRLVHDDEAFKKAYTDALGNAFKFVGVAADVHMGLFDDSKYVQDMAQEFAANEDTLGKKVDEMIDRIRACTDLSELTGAIAETIKAELRPELEKAKRGGEFQELTTVFKARRAKLELDQRPPDEALGNGAAAADRDQVNADTNN